MLTEKTRQDAATRRLYHEWKASRGVPMAEIARKAAALEGVLESQRAALCVELSFRLQGAAQLLEAKLETACWSVAEWVDVALNGRLSYRETLMKAIRDWSGT